MSVDETVTLAEQIGGALSAAHAHGVVHRDVKPSNVIFDAVGHAYLTDFGIALAGTDPGGPEAALSPGSPAYAAPEQLRGGSLGPAADVFSLGVVLHDWLVGSPPPRATGSGELLDPRRHEPFSELREHVNGIPPTIAAAINRATALDPTDRFPSTDEFVRALRGMPLGTGSSPDHRRIAQPENPYVGLRAFDDGDAGRFFGRDRLIDEIVDRLRGTGVSSRCVVVVGPSGSGKSSVVRAGVVPALRRGAVPGSGEWFTTTMLPGGDPYEALQAALHRIAAGRTPSLLAQFLDGVTIEPGDLPPGTPLHAQAVDGRLLYWHEAPRAGDGSPVVVVVDDRTLERVGDIVADFTIDPGDPISYRATASTVVGGLFAIAGETTGGPDTDTTSGVVVLDADTGTEVFRVPHSAPVNAVAFDHEAGLVVAGGDDGTVIVADLASHDVVEQMSMSDSEPVLAVGTSPEGDVIAVGRRTIETFDGRGHRLGAPVAIPSAESAWVRPDGTVLRLPLDPERWDERICELVGRELTSTEWEQLVPGDGPPHPACP